MQNSSIEWCDHTWNLVWGCFKVSPGRQHCYAETLARRYGFDVWGPAKTTERRVMGANYWRQPIRWNAAAEKAQTRARVFCCSMADVFEAHPTNAQERPKLWALIDQTPWLDWLLLTKRPENITTMIPREWHDTPRDNVWFGTSVESQEQADKRILELLKVPARVRFLSCEPLLGALDIRWALHYPACPQHPGEIAAGWGHLPCDCRPYQRENKTGIEWVICGGESGHGARPMHPDWARSLRDQCKTAKVAFHFKQWGAWLPVDQMHSQDLRATNVHEWADNKRAVLVGKNAAGRLLDKREWNGLPFDAQEAARARRAKRIRAGQLDLL